MSTLETDVVHSLLADRRRRYLLWILHERDAVDVEELSSRIATREAEPTQPNTDDRRQRVEISLHHNHLPRLADHGVIEYDAERGTVSATSRLDELASTIERPVAVSDSQGSSPPL
ncbi:DUF7344 domain-containing protein [Natrialbaceae archaeon AArc-T1-2]|uniref:DUF7344 domain-containing protein n=1 Tax=Natrialbaceae archaeon AArc-T1-2 TaxID=3053904 RepID=UPI00255B2CB9|nr:hypothetical protein [Natrialbaceae archaeon AArc-T1-2]WIV66281.1 hypothetical protein QQ977_11330 [Natrialbaceae archaeon AArc-T1-2]